MSLYTESVWGTVGQHPWKYRPRTREITGILWHSTRGGQWYDGVTEIGAYRNWVCSPNNRNPGFPEVGIAPYAGIASAGIGPGVIMECVPDNIIPAWSSWPSDESKLSVEVAQSNNGQPIESETIEGCVRYAKEKAALYNFPLTRVFPTNDAAWVGIAGHEDTQQGKSSGKSDPGEQFWAPFLDALQEDGAVTRTEYEDLVISIFSGSEEAALPREQRLANAEYRKGEIVKGNAASVNDRAASAIAVATDHAGDDALHSGDGFADHRHTVDISGKTGGVVPGGN